MTRKMRVYSVEFRCLEEEGIIRGHILIMENKIRWISLGSLMRMMRGPVFTLASALIEFLKRGKPVKKGICTVGGARVVVPDAAMMGLAMDFEKGRAVRMRPIEYKLINTVAREMDLDHVIEAEEG